MTITEIINTHTYTVDEWLLNTLNAEFRKGSYSNRKNVDALALELTLGKAGKLKTLPKVMGEKYQWRHDWAYSPNVLIDLKRRPKSSNNYSIYNTAKMIESYNMNQLTHIVGFTQNIENDYNIGDVLTFQCEGMLPIEKAIQLAFNYSPGFKLLSKDYLQPEETVI